MTEVVVYLKEDYSQNESIWVDSSLTKEEITQIVNQNFETWFSYDIL
jgi:hypothetical protein